MSHTAPALAWVARPCTVREGSRHLEQEFGLDQEFAIVELESRRAASPDMQVGSGGVASGGVGSGGYNPPGPVGGYGAGSGGVGSGSVGSGGAGSGSVGSGGGSGT